MKTENIIAMVLFAFAVLMALSCRGPKGDVGPQGVPGLQGEQGPQGVPGADGADAVLELVDPCPQISAQHPELLMYTSGNYYAVYAHGNKIHLTYLQEGITYSTTDGRECRFRIAAGEIVAD